MKLMNCSNCGTVFAKSVSDLCSTCYREEEKEFQIVYRFLQKAKNREATIPQIVTATEVHKNKIIKFLKQNRLRTSQFPSLAYPCEICWDDIIEGKICQDCSKNILSDWSETKKEMKKHSDEEKQASVYFTMNKKSNRD